VRAVVSLLLVLHLTAVFVAPMNVAVPQQLGEDRAKWPLVPWMARSLGPYLDAAYLNHGYHFFAPDPGSSALIHYTGELADGTPFEGTFPDLDQQQPRLRYHRHFMLSEQRRWLPEQIDVAYARHLLDVHQAQWVRTELVTHYLARPDEILAGMRLDDPRTYQSRPLVTITADGKVTRHWQDERP
jgi:hypothetical protein